MVTKASPTRCRASPFLVLLPFLCAAPWGQVVSHAFYVNPIPNSDLNDPSYATGINSLLPP